MFTLCCFVFMVCRIIAGLPAATNYDQRQTGELNVQVQLKDVHIVALLNSELLNDYTEYDYFYDYADFTIKPKPTPSSTTETTEKDDITEIAEIPSLQNSTVDSLISTFSDNIANSTEHITTLPNNGETPNSDLFNNTTQLTLNTNDKDKNRLSEEDESELVIASSTMTTSNIAEPVHDLQSRKFCKHGYVPDGNGRCRRSNRRWLLLP